MIMEDIITKLHARRELPVSSNTIGHACDAKYHPRLDCFIKIAVLAGNQIDSPNEQRFQPSGLYVQQEASMYTSLQGRLASSWLIVILAHSNGNGHSCATATAGLTDCITGVVAAGAAGVVSVGPPCAEADFFAGAIATWASLTIGSLRANGGRIRLGYSPVAEKTRNNEQLKRSLLSATTEA
jgi:hypothetical protein